VVGVFDESEADELGNTSA